MTALLSPLCAADNVKLILSIAAADTSQDALLELLIDAATSAINDYVGYPLLEPDADPQAEYYSGNGYPELPLRRRPVQSVTSVYVDGKAAWGQGTDPFPAATLLTAGTDYALVRDEQAGSSKSMAGLLRRLNSSVGVGWPSGFMMGGIQSGRTLANWGRGRAVWPVGEGNIKITCTAGYISLTSATFPLPPSIQQAAANLVAWLKKHAPLGGISVTSEALGKYSVGFGAIVTDTAKNALAAAGEFGSTRQLLSRYRDMAL